MVVDHQVVRVVGTHLRERKVFCEVLVLCSHTAEQVEGRAHAVVQRGTSGRADGGAGSGREASGELTIAVSVGDQDCLTAMCLCKLEISVVPSVHTLCGGGNSSETRHIRRITYDLKRLKPILASAK